MTARAETGFHWRLAAVTVAILMVVTLGAYWFVTQGPGQQLLSPRGTEVSDFSGTKDQTTAEFTVRGQWQVHWQTEADSFKFAIRGDRDLGTIVDETEPGSGVTNVVAAGTFHLDVSADGPWSIRITQGE
jgi:hypothetical protein